MDRQTGRTVRFIGYIDAEQLRQLLGEVVPMDNRPITPPTAKLMSLIPKGSKLLRLAQHFAPRKRNRGVKPGTLAKLMGIGPQTVLTYVSQLNAYWRPAGWRIARKKMNGGFKLLPTRTT